MYEENNSEYQTQPRKNPMATAALVFGILSLVTCFIINLSLPFGALAIIFALLSRTEPTIRKKARRGLICGICGMIATVVLTVSAFYTVLTDSSMRSFLEYYLRVYTGDYNFDLDDTLEGLFPFLDGLDTPSFALPDSEENTADESPVISPKGAETFL